MALDVLSESCCIRPSTPEDVEREKKVILEEIKMVEDTPDDLVHELFTQSFWDGHPLGRPILGTPGDGERADRRTSCGATSTDVHRRRTRDRRGRQRRRTTRCATW